jgi:hypothetical protein
LLSSGTTDIDTGLTQLNKTFADQSPNEPTLGVTATSAPSLGVPPPSRVRVVPLAPTNAWAVVTHGEPYFDPTTETVHVEFANAGSSIEVNVLFWDPHTIVGPGQADTYNHCDVCQFVASTQFGFSFQGPLNFPAFMTLNGLTAGDFILMAIDVHSLDVGFITTPAGWMLLSTQTSQAITPQRVYGKYAKDGCKAGTQYKPDVPCQYQGTVKGGGGAVTVTLLAN